MEEYIVHRVISRDPAPRLPTPSSIDQERETNEPTMTESEVRQILGVYNANIDLYTVEVEDLKHKLALSQSRLIEHETQNFDLKKENKELKRELVHQESEREIFKQRIDQLVRVAPLTRL